jgi:hypothetical protein
MIYEETLTDLGCSSEGIGKSLNAVRNGAVAGFIFHPFNPNKKTPL